VTGPRQRSLLPSPAKRHRSRAAVADRRPRAAAVFTDAGRAEHLWISIYFNKLPIEIIFNSRLGPSAVLTRQHPQARVLLCNPAAEQLGVRPGLSVSAALALAPGLTIADRDRMREAQVLQKLAAWAIRFTPAVSLDATNAVLLDVQASLKCFGGFVKLRAALLGGLAGWGYHTSMGCAPTARAALWLARSGWTGRAATVRDYDALPGRLGGLSIDCLRWPDSVQRMLVDMGITTLGACIRLPRDGLARRIGPARLAELDEGFGARPEVRHFYRPRQRFESALDLPEATADAGLLLIALQKLLVRLDAFLRRRQGAVQVLWICLQHEAAPATWERIGLLAPATDTAYLAELARIRFADQQLVAPVTAMILRASLAMVLSPLSASGPDLFGHVADRDRDALTLVEQLRVRLGNDAVHGIQPVPEHRPEAAWKPAPVDGVAARDTATGAPCYAPDARRPVWMLEEPRVLDAATEFPEALNLEDGPERIETGWWDGRDVRRDYYVARDRRGIRLWVFRDCRESRWYLHGLFG